MRDTPAMRATPSTPGLPVWLTSVLWPGATSSGWSGASGRTDRHRLIAVPDAAKATQFVPWRASSIAASARRASDDRPRSRQWKDAAGVLGLLTIGAAKASRRVAVSAAVGQAGAAAPSLVDHVAGHLGLDVASAIILCGPPRANQKPILQLHDHVGRTLAYVKVAWNPLTAELLRNELTALTHLAGIEHPEFAAPRVLGNGQWAEGSWLAIDPVRVGRRRRPDQAQLDRLALSIQRTSPGWQGPAADSPFVRRLVDDAASLPAGRIAVDRVLHRHGHVPLILAARHGDFVPWNILSGQPVCSVWDWERYDQLAPVGSDRIHHRVQVGIQRRGLTFPDAVAGIAAQLGNIVPELAPDAAQAHLDWYLAEVLVRYENDAQSNATPRLLDRIAKLASILEQRAAPASAAGSQPAPRQPVSPLDPSRRAT